MRRRSLIAAGGLLMARWGSVSAGAGELTVLSLTSMQPVVDDLVRAFENATGQTVAVKYTQASQLKARLHGPDHPDLVVAPAELIDLLDHEGAMQSGTRQAVGRVGVGVAVRRGDSGVRDFSSAARLRQALMDAKSLVYADPKDSAEGLRARAVIDRLGLAAELRAKTQLGSGSNPIAAVGFGDAELGLHAIDRILGTPGLLLAAPVPAELQEWTRYDAAMVVEAANAADARRLMQFLASDASKLRLSVRGIEPAL